MNTSRRRAFTLIEMMVVIVLLVIVMAIVARAVDKVELSSRRTESITRLKTLSRALQAYRDDWGDVPPYNPANLDLNGDGQPDPTGPGLWALVQLDYLQNYRYLNDAASQVGKPWITDSTGTRIEVVPGDPTSMGAAYNAYYTPTIPAGQALDQGQEAQVYNLLARSTDHNVPGTPLATNSGQFDTYDEAAENWCSWMMRDPFSGEWKYLPVRSEKPVGQAGNNYPAGDSTQADYYHRQLGHLWTDTDSPRYLPASDTVVTWSNLFRQLDRRPWLGAGDWGTDILLYADGHTALVAAPSAPASVDPLQARAIQRPPAQ